MNGRSLHALINQMACGLNPFEIRAGISTIQTAGLYFSPLTIRVGSRPATQWATWFLTRRSREVCFLATHWQGASRPA